MNKFKIGDMVFVYTKDASMIGEIGIITSIDEKFYFLISVKFSDYITCHYREEELVKIGA